MSAAAATATKRQLTIKTGVVKRLTKEEQTYIQEAKDQEKRVKEYEAGDKDEWDVKQQHKVLQDCLQMIPDCRKRLEVAVEDLVNLVEGLDEELASTSEAAGARTALEAAAAAATQRSSA
ncbi:unnamed protein product [Parajaminaea phylloscopi]